MRTIYVEKNIPKMLAVKLLRGLWPGVVWSPLSPLRRVDIEPPTLPSPDWVRVENIQCGICSTDISLIQVEPDAGVSAAALPGITKVYLGHETVGQVTETGPGVRGVQVGDRVMIEAKPAAIPNCHTQGVVPPCRYCADGQTRLCEKAAADPNYLGIGAGLGDGYTAHESEIWPVPAGISDDEASMVEPASVGLHAALRGRPEAGEQVLVVGAGIIGLLTAQMVKIVQPRCELTVMARYPHQAEAAQRMGADKVMREGENPYQQVARHSGGSFYQAPLNRGMVLGGFDRVFDCVGIPSTITDSLRWVRAQGTVILVGSHFNLMKVDLSPVFYQEVDLIGSLTFGAESWNGQKAHTFDLVLKMLQEGRLNFDGLITHRYPYDQLRRAVKAAQDKSSGAIKVTVTP